MALSKKITLTIDGYTIKLSSGIKFYQNDQIHLIFEIIENTIIIITAENMPIGIPILFLYFLRSKYAPFLFLSL